MKRTEFTLPALITPADWMLLGGVMALSVAVYGFRFAGSADGGPLTTIVKVGDERVAEFPLTTDTTLTVNGDIGPIRIVQRGGEIWFEDTPCKLKICEKMGHIHNGGEVIVCAPSRVMARLESSAGGSEKGGLDAISR